MLFWVDPGLINVPAHIGRFEYYFHFMTILVCVR
jgi:hypothetical protein